MTNTVDVEIILDEFPNLDVDGEHFKGILKNVEDRFNKKIKDHLVVEIKQKTQEVEESVSNVFENLDVVKQANLAIKQK